LKLFHAIFSSRNRKGGIQLNEPVSTEENEDSKSEDRTGAAVGDDGCRQLADCIMQEKEDKRAMEEKRKEDLLWADFMKDSKQPPKAKASSSIRLEPNVCYLISYT